MEQSEAVDKEAEGNSIVSSQALAAAKENTGYLRSKEGFLYIEEAADSDELAQAVEETDKQQIITDLTPPDNFYRPDYATMLKNLLVIQREQLDILKELRVMLLAQLLGACGTAPLLQELVRLGGGDTSYDLPRMKRESGNLLDRAEEELNSTLGSAQ